MTDDEPTTPVSDTSEREPDQPEANETPVQPAIKPQVRAGGHKIGLALELEQ